LVLEALKVFFSCFHKDLRDLSWRTKGECYDNTRQAIAASSSSSSSSFHCAIKPNQFKSNKFRGKQKQQQQSRIDESTDRPPTPSTF